MKNNTIVLIIVVALFLFLIFYKYSKGGSSNGEDTDSYGSGSLDRRLSDRTPTYDSMSSAEYELLDHPAMDGFGVGPAGAPGMTPEWSFL